MKKTLKRTLSLLLAVVLIFSVCSVSFAVGEEETTEAVTGFTEKDFLTTKGTKIVNAEGKQITLKGVNLGSWLIIEDWLSPYEEATDNLNIFDTLTERFGE